jgi:hypothetical protein
MRPLTVSLIGNVDRFSLRRLSYTFDKFHVRGAIRHNEKE